MKGVQDKAKNKEGRAIKKSKAKGKKLIFKRISNKIIKCINYALIQLYTRKNEGYLDPNKTFHVSSGCTV